MKREERPILFRPEMVRAILDGKKTQTRRVVNFKYAPKCSSDYKGILLDQVWADPGLGANEYLKVLCQDDVAQRFRDPFGQPGDRLWVRETWQPGRGGHRFRADNLGLTTSRPWKPSIFMPRKICRLALEIVKVRVQRLMEISTDDAKAEGSRVDPHDIRRDSPRHAFQTGWDSINAARGYGWDKNPWVWVIDFKIHTVVPARCES